MTIAVILHVIGTVLGVGGVTINDFMLLRAIGDGDLGVAYQRSAKGYSAIIWLGWLILVGTAIYFALTNSWVMHSDKVLLKIFIVALITVNGIFLGTVLTPKLEALTKEDWAKKSDRLKAVARAGIFPGALSLVSWYCVLILGAAGRQPSWTVEAMFGWYVAALLAAWLGSYLVVNWRLSTQ